MSGYGGGGGGGGFGDGPSCEDLVIHTQISSPVPAVVNGLKKGDILKVEIQQGADTHIVELTFNGRLAGGLSSAQVIRLIDCIRGGTRYQAEVQEANGGQIKVKVKAKGV